MDPEQGSGRAPRVQPIRGLLNGQTAIVTGADVVVNHIQGDAAAADVVEAIAAEGRRALAFKADVSNEAGVEAMFQAAIAHFGTVDILINTAGLQRDAPIDQMTLAQWNSVISVNLTGQFLCAREAIREFKRRGIVDSVSVSAGKIIRVSSVHKVIPWGGHVNYAASTGGVMLMMKSILQEVAPYRIRVNTEAWNTPEAYASLMTSVS